MKDLKSIIHSDPEIHSGDPVFVGTRVPVRTLLDYLKGGDSLDVFLENFPTVTREQAIAFLEEAGRAGLAEMVEGLSSRANRGSGTAFDVVLAKVPDVEPDDSDRF